MDRDTGRSKGFGFVEMGTDAEAQAAINGMNGQALDGRGVVVNEARPEEARRPRAAAAATAAAAVVRRRWRRLRRWRRWPLRRWRRLRRRRWRRRRRRWRPQRWSVGGDGGFRSPYGGGPRGGGGGGRGGYGGGNGGNSGY